MPVDFECTKPECADSPRHYMSECPFRVVEAETTQTAEERFWYWLMKWFKWPQWLTRFCTRRLIEANQKRRK